MWGCFLVREVPPCCFSSVLKQSASFIKVKVKAQVNCES